MSEQPADPRRGAEDIRRWDYRTLADARPRWRSAWRRSCGPAR